MSFATLVALNASQVTTRFALMSTAGFDRQELGHKAKLLDLWSNTFGKVVTAKDEGFFASELYLPFGAEHRSDLPMLPSLTRSSSNSDLVSDPAYPSFVFCVTD